jgi:putative transposase
MAQRKDTPVRELVEGLLNAEDGEGMRLLLQGMLNRLVEAEITDHLGAGPYERSEERRGHRNGHYGRGMTTRLGKIELQVPRSRDGKFQTAMFQRFQRSERALQLGLVEMYVQGVSTRKVTKVTEVLFGTEFSASTISNLAKELDEEIRQWRERPLEDVYPYLIIDAQYHKVREGGRVVSQGVLTVVGVDDTGRRRLLDFEVACGESETSWTGLVRRLRRRGLRGVVLVVSDDHQGLRGAVERCFVGCGWQRCQKHFSGNVQDLVRRKDRKEVAEALRWIWDARDGKEARERLRQVVAEYQERFPAVAEKLDEEGEDALAVFALPSEHRKRMRTTNMLERLHEEIRRRTRVVRIFPNSSSLGRLVGALILEWDEKWLTGRRYLDMSLLREEREEGGQTITAAG